MSPPNPNPELRGFVFSDISRNLSSDDSWLHCGPDQFEEMLETSLNVNGHAQTNGHCAQDLPARLAQFVEVSESDYSGVETPASTQSANSLMSPPVLSSQASASSARHTVSPSTSASGYAGSASLASGGPSLGSQGPSHDNGATSISSMTSDAPVMSSLTSSTSRNDLIGQSMSKLDRSISDLDDSSKSGMMTSLKMESPMTSSKMESPMTSSKVESSKASSRVEFTSEGFSSSVQKFLKGSFFIF